jgi:hypothetical protein
MQASALWQAPGKNEIQRPAHSESKGLQILHRYIHQKLRIGTQEANMQHTEGLQHEQSLAEMKPKDSTIPENG